MVTKRLERSKRAWKITDDGQTKHWADTHHREIFPLPEGIRTLRLGWPQHGNGGDSLLNEKMPFHGRSTIECVNVRVKEEEEDAFCMH